MKRLKKGYWLLLLLSATMWNCKTLKEHEQLKQRQGFYEVKILEKDQALTADHSKLKGIIKAYRLGTPAQNATIDVLNTPFGANANQFGEFELLVPAGKYIVEIRHSSFSSITTDSIELKSQEVGYLIGQLGVVVVN